MTAKSMLHKSEKNPPIPPLSPLPPANKRGICDPLNAGEGGKKVYSGDTPATPPGAPPLDPKDPGAEKAQEIVFVKYW